MSELVTPAPEGYQPQPVEDWEIWAGPSCACVVPAADPDKVWLIRIMVLKYRMPGVTQAHAHDVFYRGLRGGYLMPLPPVTRSPEPPAPRPTPG